MKFIDRTEVVHLLGPPGTGKSHLGTALAVEAVKAGKSVAFATLADIVTTLAKAEREGSLRERLRFLARASLLVVDEIGYLPVVPGGGNLFFQLVNARYEKGAMILTSNRGFAEWGEVENSETNTNCFQQTRQPKPAPPRCPRFSETAVRQLAKLLSRFCEIRTPSNPEASSHVSSTSETRLSASRLRMFPCNLVRSSAPVPHYSALNHPCICGNALTSGMRATATSLRLRIGRSVGRDASSFRSSQAGEEQVDGGSQKSNRPPACSLLHVRKDGQTLLRRPIVTQQLDRVQANADFLQSGPNGIGVCGSVASR